MREDLKASGLSTIAAKAYLSRKDIEELFLPDAIEEIGNWAFAHMKNLKKLVVPCREIKLGKEVFKGCDSLEQIIVGLPEALSDVDMVYEPDLIHKQSEDASYLLATALRYLGAQELFVPQLVGKQEWLEQLDAGFIKFLNDIDETGFNPMWFGGEEDYDDNDTNVEIYRRMRQKEKLFVAMCRLIHDTCLSEEKCEQYHGFLRNILLDGASEELWEYLADKYADDSCFISVLTAAGCIHMQNREYVLQKFSGIGPEGKALLVAWFAKQSEKEDFFAEMEL